MATRSIVPRATGEGGIGTTLLRWATAFINAITCTTINALTLAAAAVGFTITGGTTSKTLTVTADTALDEAVAMSDKAPKASPTFTGTATMGFIVLGTGSPVIKLKKLTGTSAPAEGEAVNIAHGLTLAKIISASVKILADDGVVYIPHSILNVGYQFDWYITSSNVVVTNHPTNSEFILSEPIVVVVMYEE